MMQDESVSVESELPATGAILIEMEHAVMDTALNQSAWEQFAQAVAGELARKTAG